MVRVVTLTFPCTILARLDEDGEHTDGEPYMYLIRDATGLEVHVNAEQFEKKVVKVKPS